ncbi:AraC family transcriptional regulator [Frankia sp. R82]|nr:AraC family transcriptional regulator [Frankia sp. R82]MCM3882811.1 AraC family transcriptional regulator [Frankia sp. R82]
MGRRWTVHRGAGEDRHNRARGGAAAVLAREKAARAGSGPRHVLRGSVDIDGGLAQVSRAIRWIREHYAEPLRIADLAQLAGLSPSAFHRRFREITALSPLQFQKRIRL